MKALLTILFAVTFVFALKSEGAPPAPAQRRTADYGTQLRQLTQKQGLAIIDFTSHPRKVGSDFIEYLTVPRKVLGEQKEWDGTEAMPLPMHELVAIAKRIIIKTRPQAGFASLEIKPCYDAPKKRYVTVTFSDADASDIDFGERQVSLLLDGTAIHVTRTDISAKASQQLFEHEVPKAK